VLYSYAAPKIPSLSLPNAAQILQLDFVHGLKHLSDIPCYIIRKFNVSFHIRHENIQDSELKNISNLVNSVRSSCNDTLCLR